MYEFLKGFHNLLRWVITLGGVWAVVVMLRGFASRSTWGRTERVASSVFTYGLHLQLLVGIVLYVITPLLALGMSARLSDERLLLVEHAVTMILAVVVAQFGTSMSRRAEDDRDKYVRALLGYAVALVLIAWATPWGRNLIPWV